MKKVYLVWDGYEDVIAVYANRDKAQMFVNQYVIDGKGRYDNMNITEEELIE